MVKVLQDLGLDAFLYAPRRSRRDGHFLFEIVFPSGKLISTGVPISFGVVWSSLQVPEGSGGFQGEYFWEGVKATLLGYHLD